MTSVTTCAQYRALFDSAAEAIEYENSCLSSGREMLPACARAVLDDSDAESPAYWTWLASQVEEAL